ncbi:hypothetical protein Tco_1303485 [Tanacetum coccineum]
MALVLAAAEKKKKKVMWPQFGPKKCCSSCISFLGCMWVSHGAFFPSKFITCKYGRIWNDDDVHDLKSFETEFPAIVFNDALTSEVALSCETTVSPINDNQINFRISFDKSDDEDYMVNMPLFSLPESTVSYFDDLDYFKDFKKEFPAIVYNDALTSKLYFLTEPTYPHKNCIRHMALPPRDQRHQYLRFEGLEYTNDDITDFEERLSRIYSRGIHKMLVLDFESLPAMMSERFTSRILHKEAWFCEAIVDIDFEYALVSSWVGPRRQSARYISDKGDLSAYWRGISSEGDFLGVPPSYTHIRDPILRICHRLIACSIVGRSQTPEKICDGGSLIILAFGIPGGPRDGSEVAMAGALEFTEDAHELMSGACAVSTPVQGTSCTNLQMDRLGLCHRGYVG